MAHSLATSVVTSGKQCLVQLHSLINTYNDMGWELTTGSSWEPVRSGSLHQPDLPLCITISLLIPCFHMLCKTMTSRSCERQSARTTTQELSEQIMANLDSLKRQKVWLNSTRYDADVWMCNSAALCFMQGLNHQQHAETSVDAWC